MEKFWSYFSITILIIVIIAILAFLQLLWIKFEPKQEVKQIQKSEIVLDSVVNAIESDSIRIIITKVEFISLKEFKGKELYKKHCTFCHGETGVGDGIKARLSHNEICPFDLTKETKSDNEIYYVIANGLNKMPAQTDLEDKDVLILVFYIKKFKRN